MEEKSKNVRIRKVNVLQGRAREKTEEKDLKPNDLVIVRTTVDSVPQYEVEKIEGGPVSYLLGEG